MSDLINDRYNTYVVMLIYLLLNKLRLDQFIEMFLFFHVMTFFIIIFFKGEGEVNYKKIGKKERRNKRKKLLNYVNKLCYLPIE